MTNSKLIKSPEEAIETIKANMPTSGYQMLREALDMAIEALKRECWIPVKERLPEGKSYILLSFVNFSLPLVGRYEQDESGGAFYIGDEDITCVSQGVFVNAWLPLPEPYRPDEEERIHG